MTRTALIATLVSIASLIPLTFADDRSAFGFAGDIEARGSVTERVKQRDKETPCVLNEDEIEIFSTDAGIQFVRTPDSCFERLRGYRFKPNYVEIDGLRMHYVDAGPRDGEVVLMLHGQPSWSYLYRQMIPILASYGYRVVVPDHIGMGKSDKPIDPQIHQFENHVAWTRKFIDALELQDINLFIHDWGSHFGFRVAGNDPQRFDRIIAANADLAIFPAGQNPFKAPTFEIDESLANLDVATFFASGSQDPVEGFQQWIDYAASHPDLSAGDVVQVASVFPLFDDEVAAYDAPYPSLIYKAAIRAFPSMMAGIQQQNYPAYNTLGTYTNPFLFLAGEFDPNQGSVENQQKWIDHVPGSEGHDHKRYGAGHFIQEDAGRRVAYQSAQFIAETETGDVPTGGGPSFHARVCEILLVTTPDTAEIWGTTGLNDCPQEEWDALDFDAIGQQYNALQVRPNGPFYTIMDDSSGDTPGTLPSGGNETPSEIRDFGGIPMRFLTTTDISGSPAGTFFTASLTARDNTWIYRPGRRIFELEDPDGGRYVMQTYNTFVDRELTYADLEGLGERLALPDGWSYQSYIAEDGLQLPAVNGRAVVINDNFANTYQLIPSD